MPAPRPSVLIILFNARIAETASAGAGATLIQALIAQQFTSVSKNLGRLTVSVSGGGKAYAFSTMKIEDLMSDAMQAWGMWTSLLPAQVALLLDSAPIRRAQATFAEFTGPYCQPSN